MKIGDLIKLKKGFIKRNVPFYDKYENTFGILINFKIMLNAKLYSIYFVGTNLSKIDYFWEYEIEKV